MSYVPADARWFIAALVLEIEVEGDRRNIVHRNYVLVEAPSAEEAYEKSLELGEDNNISYENPAGKAVRIKFRGIAELEVIGSELRHGTEILFKEDVGVPEERILQRVSSKERLSVFSPIQPSAGPDYSSGEIMAEAEKVVRESRF